VFEYKGLSALTMVVKIFGRIFLSVVAALGLSLWIRKKSEHRFLKGIALDAKQDSSEGLVVLIRI
jgi:hypothetical protein